MQAWDNSENEQDAPIFLHALWRARSTYWWSKFRAHADLRCYYEPLHEALLTEKTGAYDIGLWKAKVGFLRHPEVDAHYFDEFPSRPRGGVPHFQKRFTAERYALAADDQDPQLCNYFNYLSSYARKQGQRPMFQPNRATLRAEWMKANLGGIHLYLNRDLGEIYKSYRSFREPVSYFLRGFSMIVGENADHPMFAEIAEWGGLKPRRDSGFFDAIKAYGEMIIGRDEQFCRDITAFFWAQALAQSTRYADSVIDGVAMDSDKARAEKVKEIAELTGYNLDISDYKVKVCQIDVFKVSEDMRGIISNAFAHNPLCQARFEALGFSEKTKKTLESVSKLTL